MRTASAYGARETWCLRELPGTLVAARDLVQKVFCKLRIQSFSGRLLHAFVELTAPLWCLRSARYEPAVGLSLQSSG